ncbi:MAG: copper resistance system multicopper oxidase [Gammaproteobacteria bacterium]|nr:copper resistance system multicopper oxidase [Gammaproteobacteria bacterium]
MKNNFSIDSSRRRFVQGLALGGAGLALGMTPYRLLAEMRHQHHMMPVLKGTTFDLTIGEQAVNFTGSPGVATTVNGSLPAPLLRWKEGETVTLKVTNTLRETTSIHWHGLILPASMDGVPRISTNFNGIAPGETFTYQFPVKQSGTYWYHSHSGFQEQTGLYGPIIIDPREPEPFKYDREYVVMLSDWTDEDPTAVYAKLKKMSHYYNFQERTVGDFFRDVSKQGLGSAISNSLMWGNMRMSQRDLADVTGYTYTYLMNGVTPADGWVGMFNKGEKIRLRFINGSAMTFFDVRIPGMKMTVVAADGQNVQPVPVDEFRIGVAETYDVIVEPQDNKAYTIFAQSIDRSGYARGTLTPDMNMRAEVPAMDKIADLTHADMGMSHGGHSGMSHGDHNMNHGEQQMDHSSHNMDHSGHTMQHDAPAEMDHSQHNMSDMGNNMNHDSHSSSHDEHAGHDMGDAMAHGLGRSEHGMNKIEKFVQNVTHAKHGMDHSSHDKMPGDIGSSPSDFSNKPVKHAKTEYGPHVDMRADNPQYRLDDPGIGLRNNGRRVLTYADLRNINPTHRDAEPEREIELHLTGNMGRYMWSINGVDSADAEPIRLRLGERVRFTYVNDTMMNHPMHLHGMWSDLETGDNNYLPRKHTIIVQPGSRISYRVTADAEGAWAFHCHLIYHMAGMFRTVVVS